MCEVSSEALSLQADSVLIKEVSRHILPPFTSDIFFLLKFDVHYGYRPSKVPVMFQIHQSKLKGKDFFALSTAVSAKRSQCTFLLTKFILSPK